MRDRWAMEGVFERSDDSLRWDFGDMDYELYEQLMTHSRDDSEEDHSGSQQGKLADRIARSIQETGALTVAQLAIDLGMGGARDTAKIRTTLHRYRDLFRQEMGGTWSMAD